eukprot:1161961-Pelagomonas_calceolata.AAC.4
MKPSLPEPSCGLGIACLGLHMLLVLLCLWLLISSALLLLLMSREESAGAGLGQAPLCLRSNTATRVRQPHQLSVSQRHVNLTEIKYWEDTTCVNLRPGQQLETAQRQHADLCKN